MRRTLLLCSCAALSFAASTIQVELQAWNSSDLWRTLETAEHLSARDPAAYWDFVESGHTATEKELLPASTRALLREVDAALLGAFVQARSLAPAVEVTRQLAEQSGAPCGRAARAWAHVRSVAVCSPDALQRVVAVLPASSDAVEEAAEGCTDCVPAPPQDVYPFDRPHPLSAPRPADADEASGARVVLYGVPGSDAMAALHAATLDALRERGGKLEYILRLVAPLDGALSPLMVPGFGAALDIRNMEYKALDDRPIAEDDEEEEEEEGAEEEDGDVDGEEDDQVAGINFARLRYRFPHRSEALGQAADALRAAEAAAAAAQGELKAWDMADLGVQAASYALRARSGEASLRRLVAVTGSFPSLARGLVRMPADDAVRRATKQFTEAAGSGTTMLVNGREVDVGSPQVAWHGVLELAQHEAALARRFAALPLSASAVARLRNRAAEASSRDDGGDAAPRVDVRKGAKGAVFFINNIERDARYKQWPRPLSSILQRSFQFPVVRRNVATAIAVIDPSDPGSQANLKSAKEWADISVPVRVGVAFAAPCLTATFPSRSTASGAKRAAAALVRPCPARDYVVALALAKNRHGVAASRAVLEKLAHAAPQTEDEVRKAYAEGCGTAARAWTYGSYEAEATEAFGDLRARWAQRAGTGNEETGEMDDARRERADAVEEAVAAAAAYARDRNIPAGHYTVNGMVESSPMRDTLMQHAWAELRTLQQAVYTGETRDGDNLLGTALQRGRAVPRFHPALATRAEDARIVEAVAPAEDRVWAARSGKKAPMFSVEAVVDAGTVRGWETIVAAVEGANTGGAETRATLQLCPRALGTRAGGLAGADPETLLSLALVAAWPHVAAGGEEGAAVLGWMRDRAAPALDAADAADAATGLLADLRGGVDVVLGAAATDAGATDAARAAATGLRDALRAALEDSALERVWAALEDGSDPHVVSPRRRAKLGISRGFNGVVINGAIIAAGEGPHALTAADISALADRQRPIAKHAHRAVAKLRVSQSDKADALSAAVSALLAFAQHPRTRLPTAPKALRFFAGAGESDSALEVELATDVLSVPAQRAFAIADQLMRALRGDGGRPLIRLRVALRPRLEIGDFPLKRFYRFAGTSPRARFTGLPQGQVLTMAVEVPEAWVVMKHRAAVDLDNIQLSRVAGTRTVSAVWSLSALTVTGTCDDRTHGQPPNGLQLQLLSAEGGRLTDTLVMKNLGYFQLRAGPGVWDLRLARGRAHALYELLDSRQHVTAAAQAGMPDTGLVDTAPVWAGHARAPADAAAYAVPVAQRRVVVRSFAGVAGYLPVRKRPGREGVPLLLAEGMTDPLEAGAGLERDAEGSLWSRVSTLFGPRVSARNDTVHVFSLASGHLYERFLKIMMVSVTRRTSRPVKFWLVENFMSPQLKRALPGLAREFGYEVELVTYKWPSWLRQQSEAQRIIWGYKILFLDTLFPLDLPKIITIDADQVLRADLAELWDMDLQGAAYGYTPFCDSNKDTLGFQFWRQGFWKDHLGDRPYHISALNVVDLRRFRERAVGDQLRAIYDQLSRDPNSLANLDQDLPNYAQHQVPIHSLPIEWLWCESWCSQGSQASAKTVDLCNNPRFKEPKLDMARRIIQKPAFPESWDELDAAVREAEARFGS